jgi:hypothetical protein
MQKTVQCASNFQLPISCIPSQRAKSRGCGQPEGTAPEIVHGSSVTDRLKRRFPLGERLFDVLSWDQFGFVLSFNQCNLECGAELEDLQGFTQVHSDQYPELASHNSRKIAEWYAAQGANGSDKPNMNDRRKLMR